MPSMSKMVLVETEVMRPRLTASFRENTSSVCGSRNLPSGRIICSAKASGSVSSCAVDRFVTHLSCVSTMPRRTASNSVTRSFVTRS